MPEEANGNGANDNGKRNGRKITKHHVLPRCRGGGELKGNIVRIPERYHEAWHILFSNLTPVEAKKLISLVFVKGRNQKWTVEDIYNLQLEIQQKTEARKTRRAQKRPKNKKR